MKKIRVITKQLQLTRSCFSLQVFDNEDYRNVRFENATRFVNKNFAIDLIAEVPPKECLERVVFCNGGGGPLGHPKIYINLVSL